MSKPKLLKVGDKVTTIYQSTESGLPSVRAFTITGLRGAPRWNRLTLEDGSHVEQLFHDGGLRRPKSNRHEELRVHTLADDAFAAQVEAALRFLRALRRGERKLLALSEQELDGIAERLESAPDVAP